MSKFSAPLRSTTAAEPPRVGRPPRVSVPAIIQAALEIGLEQASLKQIAEKLGVAPATLYRHVRNRNELLRLAAFELTLARRCRPAAPNTGRNWRPATPRRCSSPSSPSRS